MTFSRSVASTPFTSRGDLLVERGLHHRRQPAFQVAQVHAVVADELARLGDAPLHQPVDDQALLLGGEDGAGLGAVQRLDALVQEDHVLERRRQLELQARLGDDFLDLAQGVDHATWRWSTTNSMLDASSISAISARRR
jgi:hypothetical protein